jgi:uncharacterized protein
MNRELKKNLALINNNFEKLQNDFHVKKIAIFGSVAKGKQTQKSDIDIIVEFQEPVGFFQFIKLEHYLSRLLNKKVDLVTKKALKKPIKKTILQEAVYA